MNHTRWLMRMTACRSVRLYWVRLGCWFLLKKKPEFADYLGASLAMWSCVLCRCGFSWMRRIRYPGQTGIFLPNHIRNLLWTSKLDHVSCCFFMDCIEGLFQDKVTGDLKLEDVGTTFCVYSGVEESWNGCAGVSVNKSRHKMELNLSKDCI